MGGSYHGADHYTPLILLPGSITTTLTTNPEITAVVTNTVHPPYIKSQEQKEEEKKRDNENIWTIPPSLVDGIAAEEIEQTSTTKRSIRRNLFSSSLLSETSETATCTISSTPTATCTISSTPHVSPSETLNCSTNCSVKKPNRCVDSVFQEVDSPLSVNGRKTESITLLQQSEIDQEKIVNDIIKGCEEDDREFFFDEFGSNLMNTAAKISPQENVCKKPTPSSEDLMSLEEFMGGSRDLAYM